jgi:hypothetical protein
MRGDHASPAAETEKMRRKERSALTTIPDTVEGATVLSLIDFILSFVFIGGIGVVLYLFPHLNRLGEVKEDK